MIPAADPIDASISDGAAANDRKQAGRTIWIENGVEIRDDGGFRDRWRRGKTEPRSNNGSMT
jgi:hypothetical protein